MSELHICRIGEADIYRVPQLERARYPARFFFPDIDPGVLERNRDWPAPNFHDPASGDVFLAFQSFLLKAPGRVILLDPCFGNDKPRPSQPRWHMCQMPFLEHLEALGVGRGDVDLVVSSHLHSDHVGWNTMWENGSWVRTFPKARHVISKVEHDAVLKLIAEAVPDTVIEDGSYDDSVWPLIEAGCVDFVPPDARLAAGDGWTLDFMPAFGHTAGHCAMALRAGGESVIFCADTMHHPVEITDPDIRCAFDRYPAQAAQSRKAVLGRCIAENAILIPVHFVAPVACRVGGRAEAPVYRPLVPSEPKGFADV